MYRIMPDVRAIRGYEWARGQENFCRHFKATNCSACYNTTLVAHESNNIYFFYQQERKKEKEKKIAFECEFVFFLEIARNWLHVMASPDMSLVSQKWEQITKVYGCVLQVFTIPGAFVYPLNGFRGLPLDILSLSLKRTC